MAQASTAFDFLPDFHSRSVCSQSSISGSQCPLCESGNRDDLRCRTRWRPPPHPTPAVKENRSITAPTARPCPPQTRSSPTLTSTSSPVEQSLIHFTTHVLPRWSPDWITPYTPGSCRAWAGERRQTQMLKRKNMDSHDYKHTQTRDFRIIFMERFGQIGQ